MGMKSAMVSGKTSRTLTRVGVTTPLQKAGRTAKCHGRWRDEAHAKPPKQMPNKDLQVLYQLLLLFHALEKRTQGAVESAPRRVRVSGTDVESNGRMSQELVVVAPEELGLDSRTALRRDAVERLESMRKGAGRLVIDMSATRSIDSAGLGVLILIQRRAAERRVPVSLRGLTEELRFLLVLTKLEDLFEIETPTDH